MSMKISYYVAMSADGYIATADGGVDWLESVEMEGEDYGYHAFFGSTDGLLMGRTTFDQIIRFGAWPYGEKRCWVWTNRPFDSDKKPDCVQGVVDDPADVLRIAREDGLTHLWLVGGGNLATQFMADGLIDTVIVSIVPTVLGRGIPLFGGADLRYNLMLTGTETYKNGLVQLTYTAV